RPGWGATGGARRNPGRDTRFNPRAPGGARQANPENHLPGMLFQSTRPGWGATISGPRENPGGPVSIHAPRVGRDWTSLSTLNLKGCFNPRAPGGARPAQQSAVAPGSAFQSTRPGWGATSGGV